VTESLYTDCSVSQTAWGLKIIKVNSLDLLNSDERYNWACGLYNVSSSVCFCSMFYHFYVEYW
jgi:hypothetical protein